MRVKRKKLIYSIPWKIKSFIFKYISYFNALSLICFLQKLTRRSQIRSLVLNEDWQIHKKALKNHSTTKVIFEFGGGQSLGQNLYLSDVVKKQFIVDLYSIINLDLVESVRKQLQNIINFRSKIKIKSLKNLESYGIYYKAPYDARNTHFLDKSIEACISTDTLEHIPESEIIAIFNELHRILKDGGIISAIIDYSDHYSHTDKNISLLNFLKFNEDEWGKYNHKYHYQNRLRHNEYINIFLKAGFSLIKEELVYAENNIPSEILDSYKNCDPTWRATSAHIILKK